ECLSDLYLQNISGEIRLSGVDVKSMAAYMCLRRKHPGHHPGQARYQSEASRTAGCTEPASGASAGALVPERWLLRCARSGAGEVRDAPPGQPRGREEGRGRSSLWCFPSHVLSSRSGVCTAGARRTVAATTWPEESPQAHPRG